ncbi:MAG TPA: protein kinase [Candidatus Acidoferrales bacterium]|nr:protein kinase [Candidatus Acidoferrales bacterium]
MDQPVKTKDTSVPVNGAAGDSRSNDTDARDSGRISSAAAPPSKRSSYQKTILMDDPAEAPTSPANAHPAAKRALGTGTGTAPKVNLSSASLAALSQRYDILSEAGHGAMGYVYKARDRETGETVALKLIKPEIASDQAMTERFKNELLFARKITHKNVCRVYEFNRIGGISYTSMEFVEGESLRSVLSRFGGLPVRKGVDMAVQICSGLKEAHAQGIVHRDLKPENVMIDAQGNVKIMDFGIARSMEGGTRLTGAMIGTPAYMSPEQVSGKPVDYRTDVYALGLVLYEMFTGSEAFRADTPVAIALKQMQEAPTPPHAIDPSIPVYVERAILKCLEKDPAKRFQSIGELENALRSTRITGTAAAGAIVTAGRVTQASEQRGRASSASYPVPITAKPRAKSRILPWAAAFAVVLLAFGVLKAMTAAKKAAQIHPPIAAAPNPPARAFRAPAYTSANSAALPESNPSANKLAHAARSRDVSQPGTKSSAPEVFPRVEWGNRTPQPWQARSTAQIFILVGRFAEEQRAQQAAKRLENQDLPIVVEPRKSANGQQMFVVFSGPFQKEQADKNLQWLHDVGVRNAREVWRGENQNGNPARRGRGSRQNFR